MLESGHSVVRECDLDSFLFDFALLAWDAAAMHTVQRDAFPRSGM